jgi:hypothetical protein
VSSRQTQLGYVARGLIASGLPGNAVLSDVVIVLFVVDLAIIVSPWL